MVNSRWSDSLTLEFVKLYMKNECLWNPVHPAYKLRDRRAKGYSDLISEFKTNTMITLSLAEVTNKIKNLRTTYGNEVNKILQYSRPDCRYKPTAEWFHKMDRCLKRVPGHRYAIIHGQESSQVSSSSHTWIQNELQPNSLAEINADAPPLTNQTNAEYDIRQDEPIIKIEVLQSPLQCPITQSSSHSNMMQEDEFEIYGQILASQLRKMSLDRALRLQSQIQRLVIEARLLDVRR